MSNEENEREYEEGSAGTEKRRKSDPLKEYEASEPMTPAKIEEHEPTAVHRDPSDQKIVPPGKTGMDSPEAAEKLKKKGMAKGTD
jgi:rhodanese-related sulfurtransferase